MYKVFYENRKISFYQEKPDRLNDSAHFQISLADTGQLKHIKTQFLDGLIEGDIGLTCGKDVSIVFDQFSDFFKPATTAGALVYDPDGDMLFIYRNHHWDLPKGHLDPGESIEECAFREVQEETGLSQLQLIRPLTQSRHIYRLNQDYILKTNHWYLMQAPAGQKLKLQYSEGITDARWISLEKAEAYLNKAYRSVREMLLPELKKMPF